MVCVTWLIRGRFCVVARLGSGRRSGWELGWSLLAGEVETPVHLASYFGGGDASSTRLEAPGQGAGEGRLWAALGRRAQSEDPGSLAPERSAPHHPALVSHPGLL